MTVFWLIVSIMVLIGLAFVLPPLFGRYSRAAAYVSLERTTIDIHEARLEELELQRKEGTLSEADYSQARAELERALLEALSHSGAGPAWRASRTTNVVSSVVAAVLIPLLAIGAYQRLGTSRAIGYVPPADQAAPGTAGGNSPSLPSVDEMVQRLEAKVKANPGNAGDWRLLARSYVELRRFKEAVSAFEKAIEVGGEEPALLVDYAEADSLAQGFKFSETALERLERALAEQPDNPKGLWLGGLAAMQQENSALALRRWESLLTLLPADSKQTATLEKLIERTRSNEDAGARGEAPSAAPPKTPAAGAGGASIRVEVGVETNLDRELRGDETVFVFARAVDGPRMPLAIARIPVGELPASVELSDAQSMMPDMKLSSFDKVLIGARISRTGNAIAESGDLQGFSGPVAVDETSTVQILIDEVVP